MKKEENVDNESPITLADIEELRQALGAAAPPSGGGGSSTCMCPAHPWDSGGCTCWGPAWWT